MARRISAPALLALAAAILGDGVLGDDGVAEVVNQEEVTAMATGGACVGQNFQTDFSNRMFNCGMRTGGNAHAAGQCMAQAQGVSGACGECLGNLISCGGRNCMKACCAGRCRNDAACADCNAQHCNAEFQRCSGAWPPRRLEEQGAEVMEEGVAQEEVAGVPRDDGVAAVLQKEEVTAIATGGACVGQNFQTDFSNRMFNCGMRTGGNAHAAGQCMAQTQGVSGACGECLGNLISCGGRNCMKACCAGRCRNDAACADCNAQHCNAEFQRCSGAWPPRRLEEGAEVQKEEVAQDEIAGVPRDDGVAEVAHEEEVTAMATGGACVGQNFQTDFSNRMFNCGMRTGGNAHAAGQCMAQTQGVSGACGECLGNLISCGGRNCMKACCAGRCRNDAACADCNAQHCNAEFQRCSGSWPPRRLQEEAGLQEESQENFAQEPLHV